VQNVGEELAGEYLRWIENCDFVTYNVYTQDTQGEIDVVGINTKTKQVYICEVATHLETGLQYVKDKHADNVDKLTRKFAKGIEYARKYLKEFTDVAPLTVMLWTPIVRDQREGSKNNQLRDVQEIIKRVQQEYQVTLRAIYNESYQECLGKLREKAFELTEECKSPVMRFLQIESKLDRHVVKMRRAKPGPNSAHGHAPSVE